MNQTGACFIWITKLNSLNFIALLIVLFSTPGPYIRGEKITSVTLLATFNSEIVSKGNSLGLCFREKGNCRSTLSPTSTFLLFSGCGMDVPSEWIWASHKIQEKLCKNSCFLDGRALNTSIVFTVPHLMTDTWVML